MLVLISLEVLVVIGICRWEAGHWDECQLAPGYQCGKGLQTRKVYCQDNGGQIVPDWRCSKLKTVMKRRSCEVTCPRNCKVSGWTDWSRCPDVCQAGSSEAGQLLMEIQRRDNSRHNSSETMSLACWKL